MTLKIYSAQRWSTVLQRWLPLSDIKTPARDYRFLRACIYRYIYNRQLLRPHPEYGYLSNIYRIVSKEGEEQNRLEAVIGDFHA